MSERLLAVAASAVRVQAARSIRKPLPQALTYALEPPPASCGFAARRPEGFAPGGNVPVAASFAGPGLGYRIEEARYAADPHHAFIANPCRLGRLIATVRSDTGQAPEWRAAGCRDARRRRGFAEVDEDVAHRGRVGDEVDDARLGPTQGAHPRKHFMDAGEQQRRGTTSFGAVFGLLPLPEFALAVLCSWPVSGAARSG
jgi:hypothetical protein